MSPPTTTFELLGRSKILIPFRPTLLNKVKNIEHDAHYM